MTTEFDISLPAGAAIAVYPPGATFGPFTLNDFEFVWIIEGDCLYLCGEKSYPAPVNSIVLCCAGDSAAFRWDEKRRTRHAFVHFSLNSFPAAWGSPSIWPKVLQLPEDDIVRPMFRHLLAWDGETDREHHEITVAHMLSTFLTGKMSASEIAVDLWPDAVDRVWDYIYRRLEDDVIADISLDEFAQIACVSPEHLCRIFKSATGHSPLELWRLARLDRALTLLLRSNYSVAQIATLCAFASPFHFSRRFKEAFGQAPSELRAAARAGRFPPLPRLARRQKLAQPRDT